MNANIIKQDINFLDKPLWFQNMRYAGAGIVWGDIDGYIYRSGYTPPDKVDILILLYLMSKAQSADYTTDIQATRYEILKGCNLPARVPKYCTRLEDSLLRWTNITIEFRGTFYDGQNYTSMAFGIIDRYKMDESTKQLKVWFNPDWLLKIKESHFFKYINFEYYKALKRPLSRRLYELLCKTFKDRAIWPIGLVKLGSKLTLSKRARSARKDEEEKIFASDVLVAVKPAINEINRLAKIPDILKKTGLPAEDLFTISYTITGEKQERVIHFKRESVKLQHAKAAKPAQTPKTDDDMPAPAAATAPSIQVQPGSQPNNQVAALYHQAIAWLDQIPNFNKLRKAEIAVMPAEQVAKLFPGIQREYIERSKAKDGKKIGPGWIFSAFKNDYQFAPELKQAAAEERKQEMAKRDAMIQQCKARIEEKGGIGRARYRGKLIWTVCDIGLHLRPLSTSATVRDETILRWDDVELETIE